MAEKQPVDISGLTNALKDRQVNISDEIAESLAVLKDARNMFKGNGTPPTSDEISMMKGAIFASMKTIQACSVLTKARPELVGKSAGRVSSSELVSGREDSARDNRQAPSRLPPPDEGP